MEFSFWYTLIVIILESIVYASGSIVVEQPPSSLDCVAFRDILETSLVNYAAIYFADNTRGDDPPLVPEALDPPTAQNLFKIYYGNDASPIGFKESIARIVYSDPGNKAAISTENHLVKLEADRVILRDNIYTYGKAGSYGLAKEKFGVLLYRDANEFAGESWRKYRCLEEREKHQLKNLIHSELAKIRNEIGEFQFGQFLGLGSGTTLAFAIDDTGSMGGEIQAAKQRAINIIDERQGSLDQPQNFVLVPFNDPTVGPLTVTHNPDKFKNAINKLYAHGGGDAPELSMRGIQLAVENSNAGSTIFVITDIDAKDVELQDNVIAQAKQKNIKVTFLLTNRMGTTVCTGSFRNDKRRCRNPALKLGYELYEHIAKSTGGSILVVSKGDIFKATEVIESSLKQGVQEIYMRLFKEGSSEDVFYVDSSLKELFVESVGECENITIKNPTGEEVVLEKGVVVDKLTVRKASVNQIYGEYKLNVETDEDCDITISAKSTKGFVKTLAKKITDTETGETRIERFEGQALENDDVIVFIDEFGKKPSDTTEKVQIFDRSSGTSSVFPISEKYSNHHSVSIKNMPGKLYLLVEGTDENGYKFQRVSPSPVEFVSLDIDCSAFRDMIFRAGDLTTINVTIRNIGETETFSIEASDDTNSVAKKGALKLEINKESTGVFPILVKSKKTDKTGTVRTITITASPQNSDNLIFKQCRLIVGQNETPDIESFKIVSNINSRFVETSVSSTVYNNASVGRTAEFYVIMPLDSFITEFAMTIDKITYPGEIKEKEKAKQIFERARARGLTAGHVAAREKSTTVFKTSVNLEANKRVVFNLKYQQLLRRSRGQYNHEIIVQTKQPVGQLSIDVYICETRQLDSVKVLGFETEQSVEPGPITVPGVTVDKQKTTAHISFKPTREQQLEISPLGLNGKFIVEYDVLRERGKELNEVVADDRHFVHFFSAEMKPMSKRVIFLLDNSASMHGRKMEQLTSAMKIILEGLTREDHFTIIMFNSNVTRWDTGDSDMVPATEEYKAAALKFLNDVEAEGSTAMSLAFSEALTVFENFSAEFEKELHPTSDFILFLTDGRPTEGIVASKELVNFIDTANNGTNYGIHTIGFGSLVDADTLAKIAARNNGSSIQIFEDLDADLQISDFFETFARPMLRNIEITYDPEQVESTSPPIFPVLYDGSEIVVAGRFRSDVKKDELQRRRRAVFQAQMFDFTIRGKGKDEKVFDFSGEVEPKSPSTECLEDSTQVENFTERLNIFMELQHMLKRIDAENNDTAKDILKNEALNQSLDFGFVTPGITSMVVLKPEDMEALEREIEKEEENKTRTEEDAEKKDKPTAPKRIEGERIMTDDVDEIIRGDPTSSTMFFTTTISPPREEAFSLDIFEEPRFLSIMETRRPTAPLRRLAFFGDPHFVIDLEEQLTICFNWYGHHGQIFNILHDKENGITVNGELTLLKTHGNNKKTFVKEIGIALEDKNTTIHITCYDITVTNGRGNSTSLLFANTRHIVLHGIRIATSGYKKHTGEVLIQVKSGVVFKVTRRISNNEERVSNHLDFLVVEKEGLSDNDFGVIGQFSHNAGKDKDQPQLEFLSGKENENRAILWYKRKPVQTHLKTIFDYGNKKEVECWFVPDCSEIMDRGKFRYIMSGLFDKPDLKKPAPSRKRIFTPK